MKVYIVTSQMNSIVKQVFRYKSHALRYVESLGYTKRKDEVYIRPNDKEWSENNDFYTIEDFELMEKFV